MSSLSEKKEKGMRPITRKAGKNGKNEINRKGREGRGREGEGRESERAASSQATVLVPQDLGRGGKLAYYLSDWSRTVPAA